MMAPVLVWTTDWATVGRGPWWAKLTADLRVERLVLMMAGGWVPTMVWTMVEKKVLMMAEKWAVKLSVWWLVQRSLAQNSGASC